MNRMSSPVIYTSILRSTPVGQFIWKSSFRNYFVTDLYLVVSIHHTTYIFPLDWLNRLWNICISLKSLRSYVILDKIWTKRPASTAWMIAKANISYLFTYRSLYDRDQTTIKVPPKILWSNLKSWNMFFFHDTNIKTKCLSLSHIISIRINCICFCFFLFLSSVKHTATSFSPYFDEWLYIFAI
jgi:hypothetical protein